MFERKFKSLINGIDEVLVFRQLTLSDESWIQETYPDYAENAGLERIDLKMFASILYRQMKNKEIFKPVERDAIDDNGESVKLKIGGLKLFMENIIGDQGKVDVMETFKAVCSMSRPDATIEDSDLVKKKRKLNQLISGNLLLMFLSLLAGVFAIFKIYA